MSKVDFLKHVKRLDNVVIDWNSSVYFDYNAEDPYTLFNKSSCKVFIKVYNRRIRQTCLQTIKVILIKDEYNNQTYELLTEKELDLIVKKQLELGSTEQALLAWSSKSRFRGESR